MTSTTERKNKQEDKQKLMATLKEMEDYIVSNQIRELSEFSQAIRDTHEDWYKLLTLEFTEYFMNLFNQSMDLEWDSIKKLSNESKAETIKEMEEYIDKNNILYFCDFAMAIRDNKKWHKILVFDRTEYFDMYIKSRERTMKK